MGNTFLEKSGKGENSNRNRGQGRDRDWDLLIENGQGVIEGEIRPVDVAISQGKIVGLGEKLADHGKASEHLDARHLHLLPGIIDSQVHFREPGPSHKEDISTGSAAAALGGVTTFLEMPNTNPPTTTAEALAEKVDIAQKTSWVDFGFFMGATADNLSELKKCSSLPACCGIKIFLGSSTGSLLLYDPAKLTDIFRQTTCPIAIHSEDEEILKKRWPLRQADPSPHGHAEWRNVESALSATQKILELAQKAGRRLHILHLSTAEEMEFLKDRKDSCTVEVTPQHLTLAAPECYDQLGTLAQMNPPIRSKRHQKALWQGLTEGTVDVIGSDHAPHTLTEKKLPHTQVPSGLPGVQTMLPLMLDWVNQGKLSLPRLVELLCSRPAELYHLVGKGRLQVGYCADLCLVDLQKKARLRNQDMASKCAYTPFDGHQVQGVPITTLLAGQVIMDNGRLLGTPGGRAIVTQNSQTPAPQGPGP